VAAQTVIHDLFRTRWSPRAFSSREVSDADLKSIFEAARWAASSFNEQPWRFFVARKSDGGVYDRFLELLVPANQTWAKTAPVLIITAGKRTFSHNGTPNHHGLHDAGQALAQLTLQATALGLHAHAMGGFDHERARKDLGIPADYDIGAAVALGYLNSPSELPQKERTRKPLDEIVFGGKFGEPLVFTQSDSAQSRVSIT
jgi:nitroreductase